MPASSEPTFLLTSAAVALPLLVVAFVVLRLVLHSRRVKKGTAAEPLIGLVGRAESVISSDGVVFVRGELWHACCNTEIAPGARVRVIGYARLALVVEAA